jgi:2-polyprenyl-3-methyl-5-hydroxy-6-metoxy-1,4-benzoquinol methylase
LENLYNIWISAEQSLKKKKQADISLFIKYANQCKRISRLLSKKPYQIDILDFGMGWGYWCLMAKSFGYNIYGFEISNERIKHCKNLGINVIDKYDDIANFKFDFINSDQVFEHIANPLETLIYLCKSLKSMGVVRISVPNGNSIEKKLLQPNFKATKNAIQPIEHINCFTTATLKKMCALVGLKAINWLPSATDRIDDIIINLGETFFKLVSRESTNLYFRK